MNKAWSCQAKNHSKINNSKTFISILASFQTIACPINLYIQKKKFVTQVGNQYITV